MDSAGRIAIPRRIRDETGLQPGVELDVSSANGVIEIRPASIELRLVRRGRFVIALPKKRQIASFTAKTVETTLGALRKERAGHI